MIGRAAEFPELRGLVASLLYSKERAGLEGVRYFGELDASVIDAFSVAEQNSEPGFVKDFIGSRTEIGMTAWTFHMSGVVEPRPYPASFLGDLPEWVAVLSGVEASLERSGDRFRAMELGSAFGGWLAAAGVAARGRGVSEFRLVGVEASSVHLERFRSHMDANGFARHDVSALHAIVSAQPGWARFPLVKEPAMEFGLFPEAVEAAPPETGPDHEVVRTIDLGGLMDRHGPMDLLICTIGRGEIELFEAAREHFSQIGAAMVATNARQTDHAVWDFFNRLGWRRAVEQPCDIWQDPHDLRRFHPKRDGCQGWINPAMEA